MIYKNPINFPEITGIPNTPSENSISIFARNDGELYKINSNGIVTKIGSSTGISETKTICFQYFQDLTNTDKLIIAFPYNGIITDVLASCSVVGTNDTEIKVEKISKDDFENSIDNWNNIFSTNMIIRTGKKVNDIGFVINQTNNMQNVNSEDRFRVSIIGITDIQYLNLDIKIQLI